MLCFFKKMKTEWICYKCGRRISFKEIGKESHPSAKCRIPDRLIKNIDYDYRFFDFFYKQNRGVGSELLEILNKIGIEYNNCNCKSKIDKMDKNGIKWCEENIELILTWLKQEYKKRNIPFLERQARALLRLAIKKSKSR